MHAARPVGLVLVEAFRLRHLPAVLRLHGGGMSARRRGDALRQHLIHRRLLRFLNHLGWNLVPALLQDRHHDRVLRIERVQILAAERK